MISSDGRHEVVQNIWPIFEDHICNLEWRLFSDLKFLNQSIKSSHDFTVSGSNVTLLSGMIPCEHREERICVLHSSSESIGSLEAGNILALKSSTSGLSLDDSAPSIKALSLDDSAPSIKALSLDGSRGNTKALSLNDSRGKAKALPFDVSQLIVSVSKKKVLELNLKTRTTECTPQQTCHSCSNRIWSASFLNSIGQIAHGFLASTWGVHFHQNDSNYQQKLFPWKPSRSKAVIYESHKDVQISNCLDQEWSNSEAIWSHTLVVDQIGDHRNDGDRLDIHWSPKHECLWSLGPI